MTSSAFKRWPFRSRNKDETSGPTADKADVAEAEKLGVSKWLVPKSDVTLGRRLGAGTFGSVYACTLEGGEETLVAKLVNLKQMRPEDENLFRMEVKIWSDLDHPHCVKFKGVCLSSDKCILLCSLCAGGSLASRHVACLQKSAPPISTREFVEMALPVASAMAYLHGRHIMHRDLKSQNVLIDDRGELQVADFGLAQFAPSEKATLTAETGSYRWMAPEVLRHEPYDQKCDVYSFAMLCWEMLTYRIPFDQVQPVQAAFAMAIEHKRPDIPSRCHPEVKALLKSSWQEQSESRPSFEQLCNQLRSLQNKLPENGPASHADPNARGVPNSSCRAPLRGAERTESSLPAQGESTSVEDGNGSKRSRIRSSDSPNDLASDSLMKRPKSYNTQLSELRLQF